MLDHPAVVSRLRYFLGSHFGISNMGLLAARKGDRGVFLHAAGFPMASHNVTAVRNGRLHCDYINVAWTLRDVRREDGGFVCIPGLRLATQASQVF